MISQSENHSEAESRISEAAQSISDAIRSLSGVPEAAMSAKAADFIDSCLSALRTMEEQMCVDSKSQHALAESTYVPLDG